MDQEKWRRRWRKTRLHLEGIENGRVIRVRKGGGGKNGGYVRVGGRKGEEKRWKDAG